MYIFTDHKPLVPIYKTKDLADIANVRLRKLVERACAWGEFEVAHIPGLKNAIADAGSIYTEQASDISARKRMGVSAITACIRTVNKHNPVYDQQENACGAQWTEDVEARITIIKATLAEVAASNKLEALTTQQIREAEEKDHTYTVLRNHLALGHPWPQDLTVFNHHRLQMSSSDGLVFFKDRLLIPASLQREAINHLHCGNQGSTSRVLRAQDCARSA